MKNILDSAASLDFVMSNPEPMRAKLRGIEIRDRKRDRESGREIVRNNRRAAHAYRTDFTDYDCKMQAGR